MLKPASVILAGGLSRRMGRDKALTPMAGKPLIAHLLGVIAPQSSAVLINSNSPDPALRGFGVPVLADAMPGRLGPLAGLLTGLRWARQHHCEATHLLSTPCDTPFLPHNLAQTLNQALECAYADIAIACDGVRPHGTIGLWPIWLADRLEDDLTKGARAIHPWLENFRVAHTPFPAHQLANINTVAELDQAASRMDHNKTVFEQA